MQLISSSWQGLNGTESKYNSDNKMFVMKNL